MRERLRSPVPLLLSLGCAAFAAVAQTPAPPLNVTVIVINAIAQPPQPVKAAHVSLTHLISAQLAVDAQGPTNPRGEAQLLISQSAAKNGDLRIVISGASNLVIYQPADGQLTSLKSPIKIVLLPKGSLALLGPAQIQAYLHRLLLQVNSLQKQVSTLKTEAAQGQGQQQYLAAAMAEFAQTIGLPHDQVDQQVAIWAQNIKMQAARATTADQRGLADFALKDYAAAARDFNEAGDATEEQMNAHEATAAAYKEAQQNQVDAARDDLRQLIDQREQAAGADLLSLKYHDATQALQSAAATANAEYAKHKDDIGFLELWLQAASDAATAREMEGQFAPADQSLPLLAQSAVDFQSLAREYTALEDRQAVAEAQNGLGDALADEGERTSGDKAMALLDQAVRAYKSALEVYTKADLPQDWARTQVTLGNAIRSEGERASGDQALALFDQAVHAYQSALEVYTMAALPEEWAAAQTDLGIALMREGENAGGGQSLLLLFWSVQAFEKALEVYTKAEQPQNWAAVQGDLGNALLDEVLRASENKTDGLLDQSMAALENALEVYTRADLPQQWAGISNDLGRALRIKGDRADGKEALAFLDQAVKTLESVLEVYTRTDLPQDWAAVQMNLGNVLLDEGNRAHGDQALVLLGQAAEAYRNALQIYTKADLPQDWAKTQNNLGLALANQGLRTHGEKEVALIEQAIQAYRDALQVFTKTALPQAWAKIQDNLGEAYVDEAECTSGNAAPALLDQAAEAYRNALEIYTKTELPQDWARTQANIVTVSLLSGRFDQCIQQARILPDEVITPYQIVVRDALQLACEWGVQDKSAALTTEKAILKNAAESTTGFWDFTALNDFLSNSSTFAASRASWIALFTAVQNGDGAGMTAALHQLEPILQQ